MMAASSTHGMLTTLPWISKRHQIDETPHIDDKTLLGNRLSTAHLLAYPGALEPAGGNMPMVMAYRRAPTVIRLITGAPSWCASVVIFFRIQKKRI
jgi:hypothetical protein